MSITEYTFWAEDGYHFGKGYTSEEALRDLEEKMKQLLLEPSPFFQKAAYEKIDGLDNVSRPKEVHMEKGKWGNTLLYYRGQRVYGYAPLSEEYFRIENFPERLPFIARRENGTHVKVDKLFIDLAEKYPRTFAGDHKLEGIYEEITECVKRQLEPSEKQYAFPWKGEELHSGKPTEERSTEERSATGKPVPRSRPDPEWIRVL